MSFDARVFALLDVNCVRSSAAHAISIICMRTRACSIRFAREMPGLEQKVVLRLLSYSRYALWHNVFVDGT